MMNRPEKGFSLIEVLVTIVILVVGLLGLAGLQLHALSSQMESYQRSQALILLEDMANRIDNNRANAPNYVTTGLSPAYLGTGAPTCTATGADSAADLCEWGNELLGTAETQGTNNVGAMLGARGCVYQIAVAASGVPGQYLVAVAWQGLSPTAAPAIPCGQGSGNYGGNDALRRVVSIPISIANLN